MFAGPSVKGKNKKGKIGNRYQQMEKWQKMMHVK